MLAGLEKVVGQGHGVLMAFFRLQSSPYLGTPRFFTPHDGLRRCARSTPGSVRSFIGSHSASLPIVHSACSFVDQ
jgi:hypothetical protein